MTSVESMVIRADHLLRVKAGGEAVEKREVALCAADPVHWINHWVWTYDPRIEAPKTRPFDLWPKQEEFVRWLVDHEKRKRPGLCEKSRDSGITFLCAAFAVHRLLFHPGSKIGFGSYKMDKVDRLGDPDSILEKCRIILRNLPDFMKPRGCTMGHTKIVWQPNDTSITGEGGDDCGRGGRTTIYFWDEAAFSERPSRIESALAGNTEVQIDVSTPNGVGNPFHTKRFSNTVDVFTFTWQDDPRKDQAFIDRKTLEKGPIVVAQEYLIDYTASLEGIVVPAAWVRAAVNLLPREDAHGPIVVGFDVAEEGNDKSVLCPRQGPHVSELTEWGQVNTTEGAWRARDYAEKIGASEVIYDVGGPGAGIRGTWTTTEKPLPFLVTPVNFGESPTENRWPDGQTAKEKFKNRRAEMWWNLRARFERAYEYKTQGVKHPIEDMISIPNDGQLIAELSSVLIRHSETGKILLESKQQMRDRGIASPNRADALALAFHVGQQKLKFQWW